MGNVRAPLAEAAPPPLAYGERSPSPSELGEDQEGPPLRPGEEFGAAAVRLAGFCCLQLGWSPDAFWRATPAEVGAVAAAMAPAGAAPVGRALLGELERELGDG